MIRKAAEEQLLGLIQSKLSRLLARVTLMPSMATDAASQRSKSAPPSGIFKMAKPVPAPKATTSTPARSSGNIGPHNSFQRFAFLWQVIPQLTKDKLFATELRAYSSCNEAHQTTAEIILSQSNNKIRTITHKSNNLRAKISHYVG